MKDEKLKIGIDIDEVLAEQLDGVIKFYEESEGILIEKDKFFSYNWWEVWDISFDKTIKLYESFLQSHFFKNILPVNNSIESINLLKQKYELFIVTSRSLDCQDKTKRWLSSYFGNSFEEILYSSDFHKNGAKKTKLEICLQKGINILIEDQLKYATDCAEEGIKTFLIDKPWNQNYKIHPNINRVKNWGEILGYLEK